MTTIVTRASKGSQLTHAEMDANFNNLNTDKLEITDLGNSATLDVGTSAGTVAAGNHNHSGVYQPASANLDEYAAVNPTAAGLALLDDADSSAQRITLGVVIGTDVQAFDAATAKTNVDQSWTGSQRATPTTDNDGSFDMNAALDFLCTPTGNFTLTFTNITQGQRGCIYLVNGANYTVSAAATTKVTNTFLSSVSVTGEYWISYWSPDGTNVLVTHAGDFV